jgi:hypothetical protein
MSDELAEVSPDQAKFFDRIYPSISRRLHDLESDQKSKHYQITELKSQLKVMELTVEQYKKKIQRIEQLLIEKGLKSWIKAVFG